MSQSTRVAAGPRSNPHASSLSGRVVLGVAGAALAALVFWLSVTTHLQRACVVRDTPYLPLCPEQSIGEPERQLELLQRIRRAPGDSSAWTAWAELTADEPEEALLKAVAVLAPSDPNSLRLRAKHALDRKQMEMATDLLVKLTEEQAGGGEAPKLLAGLLAEGDGMALLRPHLIAGSHWVRPVLANLVALKMPLQAGVPLLAEAAAKGLVPAATVQSFVRSLKAAGNWVDAYGLWVGQQRSPVPLLFNGGFNQRFQVDGFDWEVTPAPRGRTGALVIQRNLAGRGPVLEVQYTGRAVAMPVIRQYLFIAPGRYQLKGQYMSTKLRMEQGLAWAVRCTDSSSSLVGRSEPLKDSESRWQGFEFDFSVPANCGAVASLQLETYAAFEAATGFTGKSSFDGFELRPLNP